MNHRNDFEVRTQQNISNNFDVQLFHVLIKRSADFIPSRMAEFKDLNKQASPTRSTNHPCSFVSRAQNKKTANFINLFKFFF